MRKLSTLVVVAVGVTFIGFQPVKAGLLGMPMGLHGAIQHIRLESPTLAPMAYSQFCLRYRDECRHSTMFRGGPLDPTAGRWRMGDQPERQPKHRSQNAMNAGWPPKPS